MHTTPFILCVEGSSLLTKMVRRMCSDLGFGCEQARDTVEALTLIARQPPLAIVAGGEQSDYSAASLVAMLKSDRVRASIPIAVMTSSGDGGLDGFYQPDLIVRRNSDWAGNLMTFLEPLRDAVACDERPRKRVLVVEDSATAQRLLGSILFLAGYEVTIASNGRQALDVVAQHGFDLILMDIKMPVMDGREAIRRMRDDGVETPAIAVTSHDVERFRRQARALGFDAVYAKPIQRDELLATIAPFLKVEAEACRLPDA